MISLFLSRKGMGGRVPCRHGIVNKNKTRAMRLPSVLLVLWAMFVFFCFCGSAKVLAAKDLGFAYYNSVRVDKARNDTDFDLATFFTLVCRHHLFWVKLRLARDHLRRDLCCLTPHCQTELNGLCHQVQYLHSTSKKKKKQ